MKRIAWNEEKALSLRSNAQRNNVGFEECIVAIEEGRVPADIANPNRRFPHQRMMILHINDYAYAVPYVETEDAIFLKTVFPSRKHTAIYLKEPKP
jgi:hypothetical protein